MKIPTILAQSSAPSSIPYGQGAGLETAGVAERAIARGAAQLGEAATDIANMQRRKDMQAARMETSALGSQADMESAAFLENLKLVTGDPDEYKQQAEEGLRGISERTLKSAKGEQTKALLQAELQNIGGRRALEALKYSNDLYVGQNLGRLETSLENRKVTMSLMDPTDDAAWVEQYKSGEQDILNARPWLKGKTAEASQKWRAEVSRERALRELDAEPTTNVTRYQGLMSTKDWVAVKEKQTSLIKSRNAEDEKYYDHLEKREEAERQGMLTDARAGALAGTFTLAKLDDYRRMRVVRTSDEYATLHKVITTEAKDAPSDPAVLRRVDIAVHQMVPRITDAELDSLLGNGLSRQDWLVAKDKLVGSKRTIASAGQAQAEQMMRAAVGKGPMDSYDDQDGQMFNNMLREHTTRSNAFPQYGGKEDPIVVAEEIINRITPIRQKRLKLEADVIGKSLRFRAPDSASASQSLKDAAAKGLIDPKSNEFAVQQRLILDMMRREMEAETKAADKPAGKSPKRRSSGAAED